MSINWLKLQPMIKKHPKLFWGASLGIGGFLYLKLWLPATKIGIPCVFLELTGFYCPGCGITRAALTLLKLDFYQAFRYNPLVFSILPLYMLYVAGKHKHMARASNIIMTVMLTATIAFGILRNIPAFDWLAPTVVE